MQKVVYNEHNPELCEEVIGMTPTCAVCGEPASCYFRKKRAKADTPLCEEHFTEAVTASSKPAQKPKPKSGGGKGKSAPAKSGQGR